MLKTAPNPVEVQDLQFKLKCRLNVFETSEGYATSQYCSLVACASRFGLLFVGTNTSNIQAIQLKDVGKCSKDTSNYLRRTVEVSSPPTHLSVNCEHTILAVIVEKNGSFWAVFYDVKSFWRRDVTVINQVRLSTTPGVQITETKWNPTMGQIFTACKSDGSLGIYEIKSPGIDINELPAASGATCFSWSPKGKQIAVGSRDGQITQYKPDLKAVKLVSAPLFKEPYKILALQWVSNYQFIGVYQPHNSSAQASLLVVDAPKTGDPSFLNYDDICYSNGNTRPTQFYLITQPVWNILMVASSNSMEVGVLGNANTSWIQWTMGDAARAELPLNPNRQETFPIGCDFDISSVNPIPWGESTLPPAPTLLLLSHYGVLCCFNVINLKEGVPSICTPSDPINDTTGMQCFTDSVPSTDVAAPNAPAVLPTAVSVATVNKIINSPKNQISKNDAQAPISLNTIQPPLTITPKKPIELFGGQSVLTPISVESKLSASQFPPKYQGPNSSSADSSKNSLQSAKPSSANNINIPTLIKQGPTASPVVLNQPPAIIQELEIQKDLNTIDNDITDEETEKILGQMVRSECNFLESEVKAVLLQGKLLKINLGTDDDKTALVGSTAILEEFFKEMTDICSSQNTEVHILKQNLLQSWAWYEEIKSRNVASKNKSMLILLKAQPLDPASEKRLVDIQHAKYYLESQITQAHRALDEQWEIFQDYCKKANQIQIPTMEIIFQTMVKQTAILRREKYVLKDIASRLKSKSRPSVGPSLLSSINDAQELSEELERLRMNPDDIHQIHFDRIGNRTKNFTPRHGNVLRSFLKKREIAHIAVVKPQLSTSILQSPSSKLKLLSISKSLANEVTPAIEKPVRKIDFVASTPKTVASSNVGVSETLPLQNLQNLTQRFETSNFNKLSYLTSKGVVTGSPNSAFASTVATSAVTTTPISFKPVTFGTTVTQFNKQLPTYEVVSTVATSKQPITASENSFTFGKVSTSTVVTIVPASSAINTTTKSGFISSYSSNEVSATQQSPLNLTPKTTTPFSVLNLIASTKPSVVQTTLAPSLISSSTSVSSNPSSSSIFGGSILKTNEQITNVTSSISSSPLFSLSQSKPTFPAPTSTTTTSVEISVSKPLLSKFSLVPQSSTSGTGSLIFGNSSAATTSFFTPDVAKPLISTSLTANNQKISSSPISLFNVTATTNATALPRTVNVTPSTFSLFKTSTTSIETPTSNLTFENISNTTKSPLDLSETSTESTTSLAKTLTVSSKPLTENLTTTVTQKSAISITPISNVSTLTTITTSSILTPAGPPKTSVVPTTAVNTTSTLNLSVPGLSTSIFNTSSAIASSKAVQPTSTSKLFGTTASSAPSLFSTTMSSSPLFSAPTTSATSFFGSTSGVSTTTNSSIFSSVQPTKSSIFGSVTTEASSPFVNSQVTSSSAFGSSATSIFGNAQTTATSAFNSVTSSNQSPSASTAFGTSMTTQTSSFGTFNTKSSIFGGGSTSTVLTQSNVFGNSNKGSLFGNSSTTTSQSPFDPPKTTQSIFGQSAFGGTATSSPFASTSVFGGSSTFGQSNSSIFGTTTTTTSASIFGNTTTANSTFGSNSVFGTTTTSSAFGSSGPFSSAPPQQAFSNTSTGGFGFAGLNVGSTSTSSSVFGGTPANPFATSENKSIFGGSVSTSNSIFGGGSNSSTTAFGNSSQPQAFASGGFTSGQSIFGQQTPATFGSSTFAQQNPGPFSGGSGSIAQSGFGATSTFQKSTGFGASPGFGGAATFGSSPSFGGAPTFGSSPSFGSSNKVFGSTSPGFSQPQQATGFGNLADQATVGFGNLAQQSTNSQNANAPFSGNSSFSSWR